jgi:CBS domain-containing protein
MKIKDFLKIQGRVVISIGPAETVYTAIQRLVKNKIGALPVCNDDGELIGIISERDLLKECLRHSSTIRSTKVQDVMTKYVAVGTPEDDLDYATSIMKQKRVRHLPIVVDQKLEGMISIRDIVDARLEEIKEDIRYIGLLLAKTQRRLV